MLKQHLNKLHAAQTTAVAKTWLINATVTNQLHFCFRWISSLLSLRFVITYTGGTTYTGGLGEKDASIPCDGFASTTATPHSQARAVFSGTKQRKAEQGSWNKATFSEMWYLNMPITMVPEEGAVSKISRDLQMKSTIESLQTAKTTLQPSIWRQQVTLHTIGQGLTYLAVWSWGLHWIPAAYTPPEHSSHSRGWRRSWHKLYPTSHCDTPPPVPCWIVWSYSFEQVVHHLLG